MKFSGNSNKEVKQKKTTQKKAKVKKDVSAGKKVGLAFAIVLALLLAGLIGAGAYANGLELIYPNVSFEGIDLSGMNLAEAADVLSEENFGFGEDRELLVSLPADVELKVSARDAGCRLSAPDAAVFVYERCHGGSFFDNTITYLKCLFGSLPLTVGDGAMLNEEYLQRVVNEAARQVQLALLDASIDIGETEISVIKGASSAQVNTNELYESVKTALVEGNYAPQEFNAVSTGGTMEEIDLEKLYDTVFLEPVNAVYDPETKASTESVNGRSFDMTEARRLWESSSIGDRVVIPIVITEPEITTEKLNSMLFADLLAQKSTTLSGSSYGRINNIKKAAEKINGLVLNPGEEFSFNGVVGQRTTAGGFMSAGAYNNGQVVQEVGGGICQVSSTLYYCALISNLEITNRLCHYFGVSYLPAGLDATVSWPEPDFKFKNSGEYPVKLELYVDSAANTLVVKIYGSNPDGIRVEMTTEPLSYADGYGAVSYRWVYDRDGNLLSKKEEARSRYYYQTKETEEEESPSPSPTDSAPPSGEQSPPPSGDPVTPPPSGDPVTPPPSGEQSPPPPSTPVDPIPSGIPSPTDPEVILP